MKGREQVDLEFERRREELVDELTRAGARLAKDVKEAAGVCAREHPLLYLASGVAVGACATLVAPPPRALFGALRAVALGRVLRNG